jgi:hypothetical protein
VVVAAAGGPGTGRSALYVFAGGAAGLTEAGALPLGDLTRGSLFTLSAAGDVDADGYDDVVVGIPGWHAVVYLGGAGGSIGTATSGSTRPPRRAA